MNGRRAAGVLSLLLLAAACRERAAEQPIRYNHKLHLREASMACLDCHPTAETLARATIPNVEVCAECHFGDPAPDASAEMKKLLNFVAAGEPIPWRKVYHVDAHVYFSHARHTAAAALACDVCHGPVAEMSEPIRRPHYPVKMDRCMKCHEEKRVSNDCLWCHR